MMMAIALNGTLVEPINGKELHSNGFFDNVRIQAKKKPESYENPGDYKIDSVVESVITEPDNPIIAETPNTYKDYGVSVENLGYFIIPRSVSNDPRFQGSRLKYQKVLYTILKHAAFAPTTHAIGIEVIPIAIGQFCVTERRLVDLCNEGVKFKEDLVDRNIVTRAVHFFCKCQYLNLQVIHGKTLLTVTIPEFYKVEKVQGEPTSEPKVSQNRANKEEDKEDKEVCNNTMSPSQAQSTKVVEKIFFDWQEMKIKGIESSDIETWKATFTHVDVPEYLKFIEQDIGAKPTKYKRRKQIVKTILIYFQNKNENNLRYQKTAKQQFQKPESLHNKSFNKDTSPKKYNNTYDFSKPQEAKQ